MTALLKTNLFNSIISGNVDEAQSCVDCFVKEKKLKVLKKNLDCFYIKYIGNEYPLGILILQSFRDYKEKVKFLCELPKKQDTKINKDQDFTVFLGLANKWYKEGKVDDEEMKNLVKCYKDTWFISNGLNELESGLEYCPIDDLPDDPTPELISEKSFELVDYLYDQFKKNFKTSKEAEYYIDFIMNFTTTGSNLTK